MVFDVYRYNSIKNPEREKSGGSGSCHGFRNIKADHKIHQWRKFIKFISEEWQNETHRERLVGKIIFVTTEDYYYEVSPIGVTTREELSSTREEVDTRVFLHVTAA